MKVDYAILRNNEPVILVECKPYSPKESQLISKDGQLARYFAATNAKFSIITNGIVYRFFTDLDKKNIQDAEPFFVFDCAHPKDADVEALEMFSSEKFDEKKIHDWASDSQFSNRAKNFISKLISKPNEVDGFALYILEHIYEGQRSQKVVQRLNEQLSSIMSEVLSDEVLSRFSSPKTTPVTHTSDQVQNNSPSLEEMNAFNLIKAILVGAGYRNEDFLFRDLKNWMNISFKKSRAWFCRVQFNERPYGLIFRQSVSEFSGGLPDGYTLFTKGKHTFVQVEPENILVISDLIKRAFEDFIESGATESQDDDEKNLQDCA